jgi:hypothetical protein
MKALKLLAPMFALMAFAGCTKTGPAGPAGPQGQQGNANVQTVLFTNQTFTANSALTLNIPAITQSILDSGAVIGYWQPANYTPDIWVGIPFNSGSESLIMYAQLGQVIMFPNYSSSGAVNFKFEVIAGK